MQDGSFDVDYAEILWKGSSHLDELGCIRGEVMYNINPEVGMHGMQLIRRGEWDPRREASLGASGPSESKNPFWFLVARNSNGVTFEVIRSHRSVRLALSCCMLCLT